ncbi:uncharacterized protein PAC_17653 [Phialocephala subalpina]|uniref:Uncharacterized protein n=1 Tax=Phialocephala subalpina TaxID=576137 RepID=A0A1L7XRU3_9HELO|nr:uncharacterized protein PAC_17653 [Phialocephala subalpina]
MTLSSIPIQSASSLVTLTTVYVLPSDFSTSTTVLAPPSSSSFDWPPSTSSAETQTPLSSTESPPPAASLTTESQAPPSSTASPPPPPYQTGTCNLHILEVSTGQTVPIVTQLKVTDGGGTLLTYPEFTTR